MANENGNTTPNDAWDEAESAQEPTYTHFGKVSVDADFVIWPKGVRLDQCPPFDPQQHDANDRVTRIRMTAEPLPGRTNPFPHERVVPSFSREWTVVSLPSIKDLGISPRELDGAYARYEFKPARKYTNRQGQQKTATSFHYAELYADLAAAEAAAEAFFGQFAKDAGDVADDMGFEDTSGGSSGGDNGMADQAKQVALQFLPVLWGAANGDADAMAAAIAANPIVAEHFTIDSPEVQALINPTA